MPGQRFLMRNLGRVALTGRDTMIFPGDGNATIALPTDHPDRWSALLQRLAAPEPLDGLRAEGAMPLDLDDICLQRLIAAGEFLVADSPEPLRVERDRVLSASPAFHLACGPPVCTRLLVGCCGSVVAGLMAQTLLSLSYCGFQRQLDVILTDAARRFLSRDLLEAYGIRCWSDGFERQDGIRVPHVALAEGADIVCVLPATANALDRIARSACTDLLSLCITACAAPVVLCPVMNGTMWNNPGVQRNVRALRDDGRFILEPTIIFGAAAFDRDAAPMYGGHGTLWAGPAGLMGALAAVLEMSRPQIQGQEVS